MLAMACWRATLPRPPPLPMLPWPGHPPRSTDEPPLSRLLSLPIQVILYAGMSDKQKELNQQLRDRTLNVRGRSPLAGGQQEWWGTWSGAHPHLAAGLLGAGRRAGPVCTSAPGAAPSMLPPHASSFFRPWVVLAQEEMSKMAKGRGGPSVASLNNVLMQVRAGWMAARASCRGGSGWRGVRPDGPWCGSWPALPASSQDKGWVGAARQAARQQPCASPHSPCRPCTFPYRQMRKNCNHPDLITGPFDGGLAWGLEAGACGWLGSCCH